MANDLTLGVLLGATLKSGFAGTFGTAGKSVSELGKTIKQTHAQLGKIGEYARLDGALGQTRAKLAETQKQAMSLRKEMAAGDGSAKLAKNLEKTEAKAVKLSSTLETQRAKLRESGAALRKAGIDTNDLSSANEKLTATYNRQRAELGKTAALTARRRELMGQLRGEIGKLAGTVLFGKAAISSAVDFESSMADVKKVVDFDTPQQFAKMGQDITDLSLKLPMARNGIASIVAAGAQAGLPKSELLTFAEDAAKMGVAFDTTADDAGKKMAQWRKAFALTQPQVVALGDQINLLGNTAGASSLDISQVISQVGPLGKVAGLAGGQMAALGATMISMGIDTSTAATGTKNLMLAMTAGAAATPKQTLALHALGIDATLLAKRMQTDAAGAIVALMHRLQGLPKAAQAATLTQLLGRESVSAVAPLLANLDALKQNLHNVGDASRYAGSMQQEYLSRASTTDMALQLGKNAWTSLTGAIGQSFLPVVKVVVGQFIAVTQRVVEFSNKFPKLTAVLVGAATAMLTFNTAVIGLKLAGTFLRIGSMTGVLKAMVPGFGLARVGIMGVTTALRGMGAAALANPIGLVIGALAVGALLVYKYWQPIKAFFGGVWQSISAAAGPTLGAIGEALKPLKPLWDGIASGIGAVFNWIGKLFQPFKATQDQLVGATNAGRVFGDALVFAFKLITWPIRSNIKLIMWLGQTIGEVAGWVVTHMGTAADAISGAWSGALGFVGGLWDGLQAKVGAVVDWIMGKLQWVADKWNTLKGIPGAVVGGLRDAGSSIGNTVGSVWNGAVNGPAMATAGAYSMPAMATRGGYTDNSTHGPTTISIQATPAMDERALARQVRQELDDRDRANAARQRSKLGDRD